jgi:hypothetical protein
MKVQISQHSKLGLVLNISVSPYSYKENFKLVSKIHSIAKDTITDYVEFRIVFKRGVYSIGPSFNISSKLMDTEISIHPTKEAFLYKEMEIVFSSNHMNHNGILILIVTVAREQLNELELEPLIKLLIDKEVLKLN